MEDNYRASHNIAKVLNYQSWALLDPEPSTLNPKPLGFGVAPSSLGSLIGTSYIFTFLESNETTNLKFSFGSKERLCRFLGGVHFEWIVPGLEGDGKRSSGSLSPNQVANGATQFTRLL